MTAEHREMVTTARRFLEAANRSRWAIYEPEVEQHLLMFATALDALDRLP